MVGGGLAGLTAARGLADRGVDVTLFEREEDVGGRVASHEVDGFTVDRGFQVLFTAYPAARRELDLDGLDLRRFAPGAVICRTGSRSTLSDPLRDPRATLDTLLNREVTSADKLRTLLLRLRLTWRNEDRFFTGEDDSIRSYLDDRGFSESFLESFVEPFYGGITLDRSLSTSKHVFEYTFRAMSQGSIAVPANGMAEIPRQLANSARDVGVELRLDSEVEAVENCGGGGSEYVEIDLADGTAHEFDVVVVAASPPEARELTGVESVPEEGVGVVTQWYSTPEEEALETGRRILLNAEDGSPCVVVPMSEVAPEYSDGERGLLAATFTGDHAQRRSPEELARDTRDSLSSWYPDRRFDGLEVVSTDRTPFAQFRQQPGFYDLLPQVDDPVGAVVLAGDYTMWSSIQGALESGCRAVDAAVSYLK